MKKPLSHVSKQVLFNLKNNESHVRHYRFEGPKHCVHLKSHRSQYSESSYRNPIGQKSLQE